VAVHPSFEYSRVKATTSEGREEVLIIASQLVEAVLKKGRYAGYEILGSMLGEDLTSLSYEHPLADKVPRQAVMEHNIYLADFVTAENTGCVHIAPGHGMDDFDIGIKNNLPIFCPVGSDGRYTEAAGDYTGMHIRDANISVIEDLKERGLLLAQGRITHRYGHCWRCKTPIIYLATEQWFIKISDLKEQMLSEIQKVNWYPSWAGSSRFKDWVEGARDWCVSRQRYWGIPIPVWKCRTCDSMHVVGTKKELLEMSGISGDIELHRPYVDAVTFDCPCGGKMKRVEDVFDVWFDSAVASWATLRFPQNAEDFDKWWPADFITEGHDQTRGWFYSQLGASMVAFGKAPYKSVLMHGFTLDGEGKKMSKSLGNVIEPKEVISKYGADTLRCFVMSASAPWDDLKFNSEELGTINRTLNILWNVYRFPLPYMVLDKFDPSQVSLESVREHMRKEDKWILSRAQSLINDVNKAMDQYTLHRALRSINEFALEDLSRWYIQLIRPRTWVEADDPDKLAVYRVLYEVFVITAKVIAPFMPHLAEEMYQNLVRNVYPDAPESVHMNDWPVADESLVDKELETHMDMIRSMVEASSNARQKAGRKLRWPVSRIVVAPANEQVAEAVASLKSVLMDQTNAKDIVLTAAGQSWDELNYEAIPNPSTIGPVFKGDAGKVLAAIKKTDVLSLRKSLATKGQAEVEVPGGMATITPEMVKFEEKLPEMVASAEFNAGSVYVDAKLTRELESEGFSREVIRRVQDMRKELDLAVDESIRVHIRISDQRVLDLVLDLEQHIAKEIRADVQVIGLDVDASGSLSKDWDVEGVSMSIGISPA
jgi:isoleucyl-tRNA synthetase